MLDYVEPKRLHTRMCGSKEQVYLVHKDVMERHGAAIVLFFVDKDLSDILGEQRPSAANIYVTDYYSIENYLVSVDMLRRVWRELLTFTSESSGRTVAELYAETFPAIEETFCIEQANFYTLLRPVMAWAVCLKKRKINVTLKNIELKKLYRFNDSSMEFELTPEASRQGIQHFLERAAYNGDPIPDDCQADIDVIVQELSAMEPKRYIRGKFELWFFISFIHKAVAIIKRKLMPGERLSISPFSEKNAIQVLGPRLSIPQSLQRFLDLNSTIRMA